LLQAIHHTDDRIFQLMTEKQLHNDVNSDTLINLLYNAIDTNKFGGFPAVLETYSKLPDDKDPDGKQTQKIQNFHNLLFRAIQFGKRNFVKVIIEDKFIDLKNSRLLNRYIR